VATKKQKLLHAFASIADFAYLFWDKAPAMIHTGCYTAKWCASVTRRLLMIQLLLLLQSCVKLCTYCANDYWMSMLVTQQQWRSQSKLGSNMPTTLAYYYRATLCVSAVFAVARCLSVRPSVTLVDCIQTAEDIVKLLSWPVDPSFYFLSPSAGTRFQEQPLQRGAEYTGWENFRLKSPFISETVKIGPWLLWDVNRKS